MKTADLSDDIERQGTQEQYLVSFWSDIWNVSYIELRIWNQVSYDLRSYERILNNCV